ncbi:hypothetical protein AB833_23315 [Chromatiales bacterium (ex Bugula neritina AB1)]|nr:hypothetical protein AB833_23315 [Chromatiales bacterium (ex Bugula neritina AB1)]
MHLNLLPEEWCRDMTAIANPGSLCSKKTTARQYFRHKSYPQPPCSGMIGNSCSLMDLTEH